MDRVYRPFPVEGSSCRTPGSFTRDEKEPTAFRSGQPNGGLLRGERARYQESSAQLEAPRHCHGAKRRPASRCPARLQERAELGAGAGAAGRSPGPQPLSPAPPLSRCSPTRVSILKAAELTFLSLPPGASGQLHPGEGCWAFAPGAEPFCCLPCAWASLARCTVHQRGSGHRLGAQRPPTQC